VNTSLEEFKRAFSQANVGMHRILQRGGDERSFQEGWREYVMPLEQLAVAPADRGYRDHYIEWFYDLAEVAGFAGIFAQRLPVAVNGNEPGRNVSGAE
jgi:hypothetical protein